MSREEVDLRRGLGERGVDRVELRLRGAAVDRVVDRQRPAGRGLDHRLFPVDEVADGGRGQVGRGRIVLAPVPGRGPVTVLGPRGELADAERGLRLRHADQGVEGRLVGRIVVRREPALGAHRLVDHEGAIAGLRRVERIAGADPALDRGVRVGDLLGRAAVGDLDRELAAPLRPRRGMRLDDQLHRLGDDGVVAQVRGRLDLAEVGRPSADLDRAKPRAHPGSRG